MEIDNPFRGGMTTTPNDVPHRQTVPMSRCRRMAYLLPGIGARITFMAMGRSITRATSLLVKVPFSSNQSGFATWE